MPQQAPNTTTVAAAARRDDLPLAGRQMELRNFQRAADSTDAAAPLARASMVFTAGAAVRRYDYYRERAYMERLVVEDGAIRLDRLQRGAPLLNTHNSWSLEAQLGICDNPTIRGGLGECDVAFSRRESVAGYVQDVEDGIIRNVSVGYVRHRVEMVPPAQEGGTWEYRVVDWEPYEVSLVPIPADMDAQIRSAATPDTQGAPALRSFPCEFIEVRAPAVGVSTDSLTKDINMPGTTTGGAAAAAQDETRAAAGGAQTGAAAAPAAGNAGAAGSADSEVAARSAAILDLCQRHGQVALASGLIRRGATVEQASAAILEARAAASDAIGDAQRNVRVETLGDETSTRMAGLEEALLHRVDSRSQLTDNGRQYRGMSLLEIGRDFLEQRGINTRGMDRMTLAARMLTFRSGGMHTTSDLSSIFANVASKRLRQSYGENPGTYGRWARRAPNAPDFKSMSVVQLSAMPDLLKVNDHGEFKYGALRDGAETYSLLTYGRIVSLSRQSVVNDDLRAFDRLITGFGGSAARLENRTVYAQVTGNPTLSDTVALFHATHGNLGTGAGSALQFSSLTSMRTAMRVQKGLQSEELNLAPAGIIVPAALEQTAYQLTSSQYTPATQAAVNEFRSGGRTALDPIVEPILDALSATAWYGFANNSQVDTVEYCWLDGAEGPVIESEMGFEVDGISFKCREDFAAKVIDYRGLYKANGV